MIARLLLRVPVPPHFRYYCNECGQDFSTSERVPFQERREPFSPMFCANCAAVENRRRAPY